MDGAPGNAGVWAMQAGLGVLDLPTGTVLSVDPNVDRRAWTGFWEGGDRTWNEGCRSLGAQTRVRKQIHAICSKQLSWSQSGEGPPPPYHSPGYYPHSCRNPSFSWAPPFKLSRVWVAPCCVPVLRKPLDVLAHPHTILAMSSFTCSNPTASTPLGFYSGLSLPGMFPAPPQPGSSHSSHFCRAAFFGHPSLQQVTQAPHHSIFKWLSALCPPGFTVGALSTG